jgi:dTMP kinase
MNSRPLPNGFLVIFDGIDGVGKTTQIKMADEAMKASGWQTLTTRKMGGTPIGEKLREVMLDPVSRPVETDLYISIAIQSALAKQLEKDKAAGNLILMDRGPISIAAYQVYGSGLDETLGWKYVDEGMELLKPNLTIIYEADIAQSLERAKAKSKASDYFENKSLDYFVKVNQGYKTASRRYDNIITIDANQSLEAVHEQTMNAINEALAA